MLQYGVEDLLRAATGTTSNIREAGKREDRKSIGVERTFSDKWKREDLVEMLEKIATNLAEDMEQLGFAARCLSLKFKTHDYHRSFSFASLATLRSDICISCGSLHARPDDQRWRIQIKGGASFIPAAVAQAQLSHFGWQSLMQVALQLLDENMPMRVRLIGLRVTHLQDLRAPKPKGAIDSVSVTLPSPILVHFCTLTEASAWQFFTRSPTKSKKRGSFTDGDVISLLDSDEDDSIGLEPSPDRVTESREELFDLCSGDEAQEDDEVTVICPICEVRPLHPVANVYQPLMSFIHPHPDLLAGLGPCPCQRPHRPLHQPGGNQAGLALFEPSCKQNKHFHHRAAPGWLFSFEKRRATAHKGAARATRRCRPTTEADQGRAEQDFERVG